MALDPGTLYLVATPIGNLGDISARALEVLRAADWIAAEDTRHTRRLLAHFGIRARLVSAYAQNEAARAAELVAGLARGESGALVVDAGSPGVSDPGERIVAAVVGAGLRVSSIPGPSALIAALQVSGLPTRAFTFAGFLPARAGARRARLAELLARPETIVLYEAPHRVRATLELLRELAPERPLAACRELTKVFEEVRRGSVAAVLASLEPERERGEWVLVVGGAGAHAGSGDAEDRAEARAEARAPAGSQSPASARARARFVAAQIAGGASRAEAERRADFVLGRARERPGRKP